jgi:flagellar protein FlgJ
MPIESITDKTAQALSKGQGQKKIDEEKLKKACRDFEAIFIQQMLKAMRQTVPESELFGKGPEKDIFQSLFDEEWIRSLAQQGGLGIGKMLYRQVHPPEARKDILSVDFREPPKSKEVNLRRKGDKQ